MKTRILLVDDDENMLTTTKDILEDAGYVVMTAASFAAASIFLESGAFDLLVADLNLPDGSGLDLAAKARGRSARLRILLMTGQADGPQPAGLQARQDGIVDDYLVKPVSPPQLLNIIPRVLSR